MTGNAANWFVDRHVNEGRSRSIAFREVFGSGREISYGELAESSSKAASALTASGIKEGDRAALFVLDQLEFPIIFWGCLKCGVVPVAINTLLSTDVYRTILNDSNASIAYVSVELLDVVMPAISDCPSVIKVIVIGDSASHEHLSWPEFMEGAEAFQTLERAGDDIAFWLYSSGSTGTPKGVRHKHEAMQDTCETYAKQVLSVDESDIFFSAAKLFFAYGMGNGMTFPLSVGATSLLFNARPTPQAVTEILTVHKPTLYFGVPTLYAALVQQWESDESCPDVPLRMCVSAGEALPAEIGRKWKAMQNVDILDGVGSTEMLHIFLSNRPDDLVYGTSGKAVPGYEIRLVDEHNTEVGVGEIGELLVRGKSSAVDYWKKPEKTEQTFQDGWTRTGDKYEQTSDGRLIYCGRTDDMFKVSGIWVSPFEVEQALSSHSAVLEAAVVSHRDDEGLEKPKAYIVLKAGQSIEDLDDLKEFVKDKIGKWKYPRWVDVVDDLPKTATGKIQRFKLRSS